MKRSTSIFLENFYDFTLELELFDGKEWEGERLHYKVGNQWVDIEDQYFIDVMVENNIDYINQRIKEGEICSSM